MKTKLVKLSVLSLATLLFFSITGCSSSSDSNDNTITDPVTVSYAGDRTIGGAVDTSNLASSDQQAIRSRGIINREGETEIVKLYVIGSDGEETDTGITCDVNTDGTYTCENVKGGQDYITRYVKDLGNGRILEMKAPVSVPESSDPAPVTIDPVTTMIVSSVVKAVQDALVGVTSDATLVEKVLSAVTDAITNTVTALKDAGTITIPSMVVEANFTAISEGTETTGSVNTDLDDVAGIVNSDESVSTKTEVVTSEAQGDLFAELSNEEKMLAVFKALGWDEGMPGWVLGLMSGEYENMDSSWTFKWFFSKNQLTANSVSDINIQDWDLKAFSDLGYTATDLAGWASTFAADINSSLLDDTNNPIFAQMKADVQMYHDIKKIDIADRNETQMEYMAHFDPTIAAMFPEDFLDSASFTTPLQNMGQLMLVMGYLDIYDGALSEEFIDFISDKIAQDNKTLTESQIRRATEKLFEENKGSFLMEMFDEETMAQYDDISVGWIEAQSDNIWDETHNEEKTALRVQAEMSKMSWDISDFVDVPHADITAKITYPTSNGNKTADLTWKTDNDGYGYFGINYQNCDQSGCTPTGDPLISDFITGDYTFTFTYDGETISKTKEFYFVPNASNYSAKLVSPKGQPLWNPEWDKYMDGTASTIPADVQDDINEFNQAQQAYWNEGTPTFAPNYDNNTSLKGMVIKWEAPDLGNVELPENVAVAYSVSVRLFQPQDTNGDNQIDWQDCQDDAWEQCSTDIYNTWDDDKLITTTSIVLPVILEENVLDGNLQSWEQSRYELNVDVQFIDKTTKRQIANGGWNNAQFRVGAPTALSGDENITFNGTIELNEWEDNDGTIYTAELNTTTFKVALICEDWSGNDKNTSTVAIADFNSTSKTFTLSTTWNEIKDKIGMDKNIQIIGFDDKDGDNVWDEVDWSNTQNFTQEDWDAIENSYWMHNTWMHVDSYGDTTIRIGTYDEQTDTQNEESYRLKKDENTTINDLNIMIW